jgi:hypothetical protein
MPDELKFKRYPGLPPFRRSQSILFCGRDEEIAEMSRMVKAGRFTVIFGRSGSGKSSLLNAGLCPELEKHGFMSINTRVQPVTRGWGARLAREALASFRGKRRPPDGYVPSNKLGLWEALKTSEFPFGNIPVLLFDQFEELFNGTSYERQREILTELAGIIHPEPPNYVLEWVSKIPPEQRTPECMAWCTQPDVRIVIAIRSDRFYELTRWGDVIPQMLRNRFELKPLSKEKAREAITVPAGTDKVPSPPYCAPYGYHAKTLDIIIKKLSAGRNYVEGTYLQIICSQLEDDIHAPGYTGDNKQVTLKDVKAGGLSLDNIIDSFYANQFDKIPDKEEREIAHRLIEEKLVLDGRRRLLLEYEVLATVGTHTALIETLQNLRLIRVDIREEQKLYEISHDVLLGPITRTAAIRRLESEQLAEKFYEWAIQTYVPNPDREKVMQFLEEKMIINGIRARISGAEMIKGFGEEYILHNLVNARLLNEISTPDGPSFYEIRDDLLLQPMGKSKQLRELQKETARLQRDNRNREARLGKQREEIEEQTKQKKDAVFKRNISLVAALGLSIAFAFAFIFFQNSQRYLKEAKTAQGATLLFAAAQEYDKNNPALAFRLYQESDRITGGDSLQQLLKRQPFGLLHGWSITPSADAKWFAVKMHYDGVATIYNGSDFTPIMDLKIATIPVFVPRQDLLCYIDSFSHPKFVNLDNSHQLVVPDRFLDSVKVSPADSLATDSLHWSSYEFSEDGDLIVFTRKTPGRFYYSLSEHKALSWINSTYASLSKSKRRIYSQFLGPYLLFYTFTPLADDDEAVIFRYAKETVQYHVKSISAPVVDEFNGKMYSTVVGNKLLRFDARSGKMDTLAALPLAYDLADCVSDTRVILRNYDLPPNYIIYDISFGKFLSKTLPGAKVYRFPKGRRIIAYTGADSLTHVLDPSSMRDSTLPVRAYKLEEIYNSNYLLSHNNPLPDSNGQYTCFNIDSPAVQFPVRYDRQTIIKVDSTGHPWLLVDRPDSVVLTDLTDTQRRIVFPFKNAPSETFYNALSRVLQKPGGDTSLLLISRNIDFLFVLDPRATSVKYLDRVFPPLTAEQRKSLHLLTP